MEKILGIIPSAGKGSRWGGYYKELLPLGDGEWLLDRCIKSMNIADEILIITSKDKIGTHVSHLNDRFPNVSFTLQKEGYDIMGAIRSSYPFTCKYNLFAMPDTVYPKYLFDFFFPIGDNEPDFLLGMFQTTMPERFGVLHVDKDGEKIVNKQKSKNENSTPTVLAWGSMIWSDRVVDLWQDLDIIDYTEAINVAIREFGFHSYPIDYYFDMATWKDYKEFIYGK